MGQLKTKKAHTAVTVNANVQNEVINNCTQYQKVFLTYHYNTLTMKECDKICGVMRENICRYNKMLNTNKLLHCIGKRKCSITKHLAKVYTTNPNLVPADTQLKLFANA